MDDTILLSLLTAITEEYQVNVLLLCVREQCMSVESGGYRNLRIKCNDFRSAGQTGEIASRILHTPLRDWQRASVLSRA
jgi:hypothetical protein